MLLRTLSTLVAALSLLASSAAAQNLVQNGDFENTLTGWTGSGPGSVLGVASFDTTGSGKASKAFRIYPGGDSFAPPHAPYVLETTVLGIPNVDHLLTLDVHVIQDYFGDNFEGGILEFHIEDVQSGFVKAYEFTLRAGRVLKQDHYRHRLSGVFQFRKSGTQKVQLHIARPNYVHTAKQSPLWSIDNVSIVRGVLPPYAHCEPVREVGGQFAIDVQGKPQSIYALFTAFDLDPTGLQIPGIGLWELDFATTFWLDAGVFGPASPPARFARKGVSLLIPPAPSLVGLDLSFQCVGLDNAQLRLGPANVRLYVQADA
jgi:hypothetical protein